MAVTDITVTAQGAPVSATVSTLEAAQAGSAEVKQLTLRALRQEPAPVSVNISTPQAGQAGLTEINDIVFTAPTVPGSYDVFFMTDGVVQLENAAVAGLSELQRLTLVGDTSAAPAAATVVVSTSLVPGMVTVMVSPGTPAPLMVGVVSLVMLSVLLLPVSLAAATSAAGAAGGMASTVSVS